MKFVFAVSSGAIIYVVETEPKYQECNTGMGNWNVLVITAIFQ